jgi:hypothetical protein
LTRHRRRWFIPAMHPQRPSNRGFGLTFAAFFVVLFGLVWWIGDHMAWWLLVLAAVFLLFSLVAPALLMPVNRLWMMFVVRLSTLSNGLLLGIIFYGPMLATAAVLRALKSDPMARRRDPAADSYWTPVKRGATHETLRDLF